MAAQPFFLSVIRGKRRITMSAHVVFLRVSSSHRISTEGNKGNEESCVSLRAGGRSPSGPEAAPFVCFVGFCQRIGVQVQLRLRRAGITVADGLPGRHAPAGDPAAPATLQAASAMKTNTLTPELLHRLDAYWRAANYLSVGQNFIYAHLNRVIKKYDLDMIYVSGPGHGGPSVVANTYLEGTYSEIYPHISQNEAGLRKLFLQFSFPGGIPSHASPECPGSIHEGGELGYSLSHAFGAVFDNPELVVACVVGGGEAETGPLATACCATCACRISATTRSTYPSRGYAASATPMCSGPSCAMWRS